MATKEEKTPSKLPIFGERLKSLRPENMTQAEFAKFLGLSRPTLAFYENGDRLPDAATIKRICEKCKVSADWLLGLSDVQANDISIQQACKYTGLSEKALANLTRNNELRLEYQKITNLVLESHNYLWFVSAMVGLIKCNVEFAGKYYYSLKHDVELQERLQQITESCPDIKKYIASPSQLIVSHRYLCEDAAKAIIRELEEHEKKYHDKTQTGK